jgi:hypothetical protein
VFKGRKALSSERRGEPSRFVENHHRDAAMDRERQRGAGPSVQTRV